MPRYSDNNTIVVTQSTERICAIPDYNDSLIQQFNINGTSNYTIHVFLESDPAALQALQYFRIIIDGYSTEYKLAYKFVSMILSVHVGSEFMHNMSCGCICIDGSTVTS